jgi:Cu+-exporting ATPase
MVVTVLFVIVSCKNNVQPEVKTVETSISKTDKKLNPNATYAKAEFTIKGMTCEIGCARTIQKNLAKMDGVKSAKVDFENELAMVEFDETMVDFYSLENAVTKTSETYEVSDIKTVDTFSNVEKVETHHKDCNGACCKDKTETEKMACSKDCTKPCCADKKGKA